MTTIIIKDDLRAQVEASTGGAVTVLYTAAGHPSYMNVIPKFNLQDIDASLGNGIHPAFVVNGVEKSEIFIGQYQGIVKDNTLLSIPGVIPTVSANFDQFLQWAKNNGAGWHVMTNAEWAAISLWCWKNGTLPRGNTNWGKNDASPFETGRRGDNGQPGSTAGDGKTYTGSGPASWRHNGMPHGIADLNGNVWEWISGFRLNEGEIQVLANNDAADNTKDQSSGSALWKAIKAADGSLVAPGTAGTLKYDAAAAVTGGGAQAAILSDSKTNATNPGGNDYYSYNVFDTMGVKAGLTVPSIAKALGFYPVAGSGLGSDVFSMRNHGERLPLAGGVWVAGSGAGVFARNLGVPRTHTDWRVGARAAYVL